MLVPSVIILALIGYNYSTLYFGEEILLKTAPIDPRDLFRGDYVRLNYEISTVDLQQTPYDSNFTPGEAVYAVLSKDEKYWSIKGVGHNKPELQSEEACMKGNIASSFNNRLRITWGIESYFVPENMGKDIEREIRNVSVMVAVDSTCRAMIKELYIDDEPVKFES